jgi:cytochrome P450
MTLYPEVQKRAQAEIDGVVGQDRFPTFEDRDKLPYIAALIQEITRWAPVAPQGQTCINFAVVAAHPQQPRTTTPRNERRRLRRVSHT